ncbi:uncharacterized protein [Choristoneura fumiferana]|uniref:uncharacterized protein n=1 Tax=Choristoneura fumiferana TaxID=7141 RepID=UPI003D157D9A
MYAPRVLLLCCVAGNALGYYPQRDAPYNLGPNDPYSVAVNPNLIPEPSQRLFWNKLGNNGQGSNQVGGTGLWAMFTNKFPFLGNMFGRMELPNQYGPPQFNSNQYDYYSAQGYQSQPQYNQVPPQFYQGQQFYQQQFPRNFAPAGRDVALTDDAVIVTPPHVPIAPAPVPAPEPAPGGYQYNKPQYRLELPHK